MDYSKYIPCMAEGKSRQIIEDFWNLRREKLEEGKAILAEFGAESAVEQRGIIGLTFKDDKHPEGWKRKGRLNGRAYFAPERRKKADKAIWDRWAKAAMPQASTLHRMLTGDTWGVMTNDTARNGGVVIRYTTYEMIGDDVILLVPIPGSGDPAVPDGARPLKQSEFWAIKEAA